MKNLFFILILSQLAFSQTIEDAWVYFKDKPSSAKFLANPTSMLTQRSIDRRKAQSIPIDITDVPIEESYITKVKASSGITMMAKSKWQNCLHIRGIQGDINKLKDLVFVDKIVWARKNLNVAPKLQTIDKLKNEVSYKKTDYNYGESANQVQMLNIHQLHKQNFEGEGKIIAVLDGGFPGVNTQKPFENLIKNNRILGGYNFLDKNSNYFTRHFHGTIVLSTMGAIADNEVIGTAPKASYYLFITDDADTENPVEESYFVEAAELADYYGVDIINASLSYMEFDDKGYSHSFNDMTGDKTFSSKGVNMAFSKGIVVVVSAGNSGNSATNPYITAPSDAFGALSIGSVNAIKSKAADSSIGGTFLGDRIKPDLMARGVFTRVINENGQLDFFSGTSFAAPLVAGGIASFWSAKPNLTAKEVVQLVRQSADKYTKPNYQFGYGIPDFQSALGITLNNSSFETDSVVVSPNPAKDFIKVNINNSSFVSFVLYNSLGQKVLDQTLNPSENTINVNSLSKGIYYYEVSSSVNIKGKMIKE